MRPAVASAARRFQQRFEGFSQRMYLDGLGLVTTGVGNKIDPEVQAYGLPWRKAAPGGSRPAIAGEVSAEWQLVKSRRDLIGAPLPKREAITTLWLEDDVIDALFASETARMWSQIVAGYPDADTWPAAAQLATLSMCWAMGAGRIIPGDAFQYPHFRAALLAKSWGIAAQECKMNGVGVDGRNAANKALFLGACGGDPDLLPSV